MCIGCFEKQNRRVLIQNRYVYRVFRKIEQACTNSKQVCVQGVLENRTGLFYFKRCVCIGCSEKQNRRVLIQNRYVYKVFRKIEQACTNSKQVCVQGVPEIEQACSISKEVYVCCSKIVDSVFPAKGRCAQSVSIKNRS